MIKRLLFLTLGLSVFQFAFSAKIPDWIDNPYGEFSNKDYLVAVCDSDDKETAELLAVEKLASVFGQDYNSESEAESRMRETVISSNEELIESDKSFNRKILRSIDQDNLIGIEIAQSYYDKKAKRYYVLAILDRQKAFSIYESIVKNNDSKANAFIQAAKKDFYTLYSYSCLETACNYAKINEKYSSRLEVLDFEKGSGISDSLIKTSEVVKMQLDVAKNISISINIQNDLDRQIELAFSEVLTDLGFNVSSGKTKYLLSGNTTFVEKPITDKKIINCDYSLSCEIIDLSKHDKYAPWNINGREGSKTSENAKQRIINSIRKKILTDYKENFKNHLGEQNE